MEGHEFEAVDPLVTDIEEQVEALVEGDALAIIKRKLKEISEALGEPYTVTLDITLNLFDSDREQAMPLLQVGLESECGSPARQHRGDASVQRYLIDGRLHIVPHDYCPDCWAVWDFKEQHPTCLNCGVSLGDQLKFLLDTEICPHCESGRVTASDPNCTECDYRVNPAYVVWG